MFYARLLFVALSLLATPALAAETIPISGLPRASTPLAGTEYIPLVQGGITRRVSALDLAGAAPKPFTGTPSQWPWQLNADGTFTLKQPSTADLSDTLKADATVYANFLTGSDGSSCLSSAAPCKTLQGAVNKAQSLNRNGKSVTVQLADSASYAQAVISGNGTASWTADGAPSLTIQGNCVAPTNVVVTGASTHAIRVTNGGVASIQCVKVVSTGSAGNGIQVDGFGVAFIDKINFGSSVGTHLDASRFGYVQGAGSQTYWYSGNPSVDSIHVDETGQVFFNSPNFTCTAGYTSIGGDYLGVAGYAAVYNPTYTSCGSVVNSGFGKKAFVHNWGRLQTGLAYPGNLTVFPGSNAASTQSGGYIDYAFAPNDGWWVYCGTTTSINCPLTVYSSLGQITSTNAGSTNTWKIENLGTTNNTTSQLVLNTGSGTVHQFYMNLTEDGSGNAAFTMATGSNVGNLNISATGATSSIGFTAGNTFWMQLVGPTGALIPATSSQSIGDSSHYWNGLYAQQAIFKGGTSGTTIIAANATAAGTLTLPTYDGTVAVTNGSFTNGHCLQWTATGIQDAGASCSTASGSVNSGTAGQLAYYAGSGTTVSGTNAGTGVLTALGNALNGSGGLVGYSGNIGAATGTSLNLTGGLLTDTYNWNGITSGTIVNNYTTGGSIGAALQAKVTGGGVMLVAYYNGGTPYMQLTQGTLTSAFLFDAENINFRNPNGGYTTTLGISSTGIAVGGTISANGLPGSAGGGGLYVCVDTSGNFYKKAACP